RQKRKQRPNGKSQRRFPCLLVLWARLPATIRPAKAGSFTGFPVLLAARSVLVHRSRSAPFLLARACCVAIRRQAPRSTPRPPTTSRWATHPAARSSSPLRQSALRALTHKPSSPPLRVRWLLIRTCGSPARLLRLRRQQAMPCLCSSGPILADSSANAVVDDGPGGARSVARLF